MSDVGLHRLNRMSMPDALKALGSCCGSSSWSFKMSAGRPYPSRADLLRFSDLKFRSLTRQEWLEAFAHHAPLKERLTDEDGFTEEQLLELEENCTKYRRRFGHAFVIAASGIPANEVLAQLRRRLRYDPYDELGVAGEQQAKITRRRLIKLLDSLAESVSGEDRAQWAEDHHGPKPPRRGPTAAIGGVRDSEYIKARGSSLEGIDEQAKKSA